MAEYWKSTKKHHCAICNIWLPAHPRSIATHNASEIHNSRKDHALQKLEREAADKAAEERNLQSQLLAIEAAAVQSMKRQIDGVPPPIESVGAAPTILTYKEAMSRVLPPALGHMEKQKEMQRLEAFIGGRVSTVVPDTNSESQIDGRQPGKVSGRNAGVLTEASMIVAPLVATYYGDFDEIPEVIKLDPKLQIRTNWVKEIHESTGLPIWFFPMRNLYVWSEPIFLASSNDDVLKPEKKVKNEKSAISDLKSSEYSSKIKNEKFATGEDTSPKSEPPLKVDDAIDQIKEDGGSHNVSDDGSEGGSESALDEPDLAQIVRSALAIGKHGDDEGVPGRWQVVEKGQEMTNRDAVFVDRASQMSTNKLERNFDALMSETNASDPLPGKTSAMMLDKYDQVDMVRLDRSQYIQNSTTEEKTRPKKVFKKRKTAAQDPLNNSPGNSFRDG